MAKSSTIKKTNTQKKPLNKWIKIGLPVAALIIVAGIGTYLIRQSSASSGNMQPISIIGGHNCISIGKYPQQIQQGSRGECVKAFQLGINNWIAFKAFITKGQYPNNPIAADGIFGATTTAKAKEFQRENGLTADGIVGSNTWDAFLRNCAVTKTCSN